MSPERYARICEMLATRQPDLTVCLEQVHKPHNVSAIIRTADAVGSTGMAQALKSLAGLGDLGIDATWDGDDVVLHGTGDRVGRAARDSDRAIGQIAAVVEGDAAHAVLGEARADAAARIAA